MSEFSALEYRPELHLFLLWEKARTKEAEILSDLQQQLALVGCYDVSWSPKQVSANFTRFYGQKLGKGSFKEKECGSGPFLLVVVVDDKPAYSYVETSRGVEWVNTRLFDLKRKYRAWTSGGHKIHATNSPEETNHDLTLLLGINYDDYWANKPRAWNGEITRFHQDLAGAVEWKSLAELFYVLNGTTSYAVLRNHESLPDGEASTGHGDIDLLVSQKENAAHILNAVKVFKEPHRVHYKTRVAGEDVYFDLRFVGDRYYDPAWESRILKQRRLNSRGIHVLDDENYFFTLVYHALIHKKIIAVDYYKKTGGLFEQLHLNQQPRQEYPSPFDHYFQRLKLFMKQHGYAFSPPDDASVHYNRFLAEADQLQDQLERGFCLTDLELIQADHRHGPESVGFKGMTPDRQPVLVTCKGEQGSCKREFLALRTLNKIDPVHFARPFFYKLDKGRQCLGVHFAEGGFLENVIGRTSPPERASLIEQFWQIISALDQAGLFHPNLASNAFRVTNHNELVLLALPPEVTAGHESRRHAPPSTSRTPPVLSILESIGRPAGHENRYDTIYTSLETLVATRINPADSNAKPSGFRKLVGKIFRRRVFSAHT